MPITPESFVDRKITEHQANRIDTLKKMYKSLAEVVVQFAGDSRERELALETLKQSSMWATQAISHERIPYYHD